jgi:hypothetical protein
MSVNNVPRVLVKIDNFCDYVPFVSSVINMVDLFQKCVILPLIQKSTVQASQYYKHLDQKSFARCALLMIPVFGNIIIGVYDFSNRKYGNKTSILAVAQQNKEPSEILPCEIISEIFSYLNLHELGVSSRVSKRWETCASSPLLWRAAIYREIAFSSKNWAQWDENIVKGVDFTKEHLSLPENIVEEFRRSYKAFPGKRIRETHVLVRMPKGLTIKKLGELAKKYFPSNAKGYRGVLQTIIDKLGDKPADESVWLLMTTKEVDGTRNKNYIEQKDIVAELAKTALVPYEIPTTLEAATCILAEYSRSKKRLFSDRTYTRCQETVQIEHMIYHVIVGQFIPAGLAVFGLCYDSRSSGAAALRKF